MENEIQGKAIRRIRACLLEFGDDVPVPDSPTLCQFLQATTLSPSPRFPYSKIWKFFSPKSKPSPLFIQGYGYGTTVTAARPQQPRDAAIYFPCPKVRNPSWLPPFSFIPFFPLFFFLSSLILIALISVF